jgi:hypothetical protein
VIERATQHRAGEVEPGGGGGVPAQLPRPAGQVGGDLVLHRELALQPLDGSGHQLQRVHLLAPHHLGGELLDGASRTRRLSVAQQRPEGGLRLLEEPVVMAVGGAGGGVGHRPQLVGGADGGLRRHRDEGGVPQGQRVLGPGQRQGAAQLLAEIGDGLLVAGRHEQAQQ